MTEVNPQTGPVLRRGRRARRHPRAAHRRPRPRPATGARPATIPFFGGLTSTRPHARRCRTRCPNGPGSTRLDRSASMVRFEAQSTASSSSTCRSRPMLGTVGVAPAGREVRTSLVPDTFGGNMDTPEMQRRRHRATWASTSKGALFSIGDGHYRQGEGESCGTAVEGAMDVTLIVELIKGGAPPWPRLETDDHYAWSARRARWRTPGGPARSAWSAGSASCTGSTARRLPAAHPDQPGAAGQRRRRQLQRGHQDGEVAAAAGAAYDGMHSHLRERRDGTQPLTRTPTEEAPVDLGLTGRARHGRHQGHRPGHRRGAGRGGRAGRVLRAHRRRRRGDQADARGRRCRRSPAPSLDVA